MPALDGVQDKLARGAKIADVGRCALSVPPLLAQKPREKWGTQDFHRLLGPWAFSAL
jgi:hypothetical protein